MAKDSLEDALSSFVRRRRPKAPQVPPVTLNPGCAYGVRYAQLLEDLQKDLAEVKTRLNGLIFLLAGTVAVDVIVKIIR